MLQAQKDESKSTTERERDKCARELKREHEDVIAVNKQTFTVFDQFFQFHRLWIYVRRFFQHLRLLCFFKICRFADCLSSNSISSVIFFNADVLP